MYCVRWYNERYYNYYITGGFSDWCLYLSCYITSKDHRPKHTGDKYTCKSDIGIKGECAQ